MPGRAVPDETSRVARWRAPLASALVAALSAMAGVGHASDATAQTRPSWTLEGFAGAAYNLPTDLSIQQDGYADIDVDAEYDTRAFEAPAYYVLRLGRSKNERAWEFELIHHKLYLTNPPSDVQHFSVSHGFNMLMLNRAWERRGTNLRAGAGVVVVHPENSVRGLELVQSGGTFGGGYSLTGPALQGDVGQRILLGAGFSFALEGKLTLAYARVPVAGGHSTLPNIAFHALAGFGYRFGG